MTFKCNRPDQNAEVLLKIIQMWQDIRLTNPTGHNQFLGDMFEGFLDQGVKQSEGQYFTPMPICRFILMSLPLESLVKQSATPPKAIDYACGAGHFLNELALQLKPLVAQHKQAANGEMAEYHKALYGIEKEYRLSKVAKVSAFMYGQQDINICYGDALVNQHSAFPEIRDHSFDLLVANPPYSVKGFLETLPEAERAAYALTDTIDKLDTNNSIETFFIERAKQLLKAGGVAAIILPSSILSNGNGTYIKTREILLQYFDIVAIAEFGSGTFGKTGTNTVTLFLRRKQTAPDRAEHYRERVAEWFASDENQPVYQDEHLIDRYAAHIGIPAADYKTLLQGDAHGPLPHRARSPELADGPALDPAHVGRVSQHRQPRKHQRIEQLTQGVGRRRTPQLFPEQPSQEHRADHHRHADQQPDQGMVVDDTHLRGEGKVGHASSWSGRDGQRRN